MSQLLGYLEMLWQYVHNLVTGLITGVTILVTSLSFPQMLVNYMPPLVGSAILVTIAIYVVRFIMGK